MIFDKVANILINYAKKNCECRIIYNREGNPYLERFYFINLRPYLRITIHRTIRSDEDGLHDHPWNWISLILKGYYYEETPEGTFCRKAGHIRYRKGTDFHRLRIGEEETWSMFVMFKRYKEWGFLNKENKWQNWQTYLYDTTGKWHEDRHSTLTLEEYLKTK